MTVLMTRSDDDYREFVGSFADPLSRLAFLLTVGLPVDAAGAPDDLVAGALAQLRWRWREVESTGAPEPLAVEALVSVVRRRFRRRRRPPSPSVVDAAEPAPPASTGSGTDTADTASDVDERAMHDVTWTAWQHLLVTQRLPLVLADLSVASRRLAGIDVSDSLGSARRRWHAADDAANRIRAALLRDPATRRRAAVLGDAALADLVQETLRERASSAPGSVGAYVRVEERVRRTRRRVAMQVALAVVVLVGGVVTAVKVSTPKSSKAVAAAAASAASATPSRLGSFFAGAGNISLTSPVVAWPARGNAAANAVLLAQLTATFLQSHPDVIGSAQVLLAADTPSYRIAYVVGNSPAGVVQTWFYGKVGSTNLVEGPSTVGSPYSANASVLASILVDPLGGAELVVIAPPVESGIQISNFDPDIPLAPGRVSLIDQHGVAIDYMAAAAESTIVVHVRLGAVDVVRTNLPKVAIGQGLGLPRSPAYSTASAAPSSSTASSAPVTIVSGRPDPQVLADALAIANVWHATDAPTEPLQLKVLWGGSDVA
ncbi:MAG: hypothetical protein QOG69_2607, partial [Actinomycetota bacterium]|nr:hypothetical protein [Actinomycetota bacterium]